MVTQYFRQTVVRNPAGQVVHVMDADIASEPPQHRRKIVMRGAMQRRLGKPPILARRPVGLLELVLHIKEPNAGCTCEQHDRKMDQEKRSQTTAQTIKAASVTIAKFVAMVEIHGRAPEFIIPNGRRCLNRKSQAGPIPNMTSGCRYSR